MIGESRVERRKNRLLLSWGVLLFTIATLGLPPRLAQAQDEQVPPALVPWIPWVLADLGEAACTLRDNQRICQWPTAVDLELTDRGGTFRLFVNSERKSFRPLIGGEGSWPVQVEVDGKRQPVVAVNGKPSVELSAGAHEIRGELHFGELPETLEVGSDLALVRLSLNGEPVPVVKREGDRLWLRGLAGENDAAAETEHVEVSVFRRLLDGMPLVVETRVLLKVSGRSRELVLEQPLLPGTLPLSITSDLAVAMDARGNLRTQLVAGEHQVTLLARQAENQAPLRNRSRSSPWPEEEVWAFHPDPQLRAVSVRGARAVDSSQTDLPQEWRKDAAFLVGPDTGIELGTTRRGQEHAPENRIQLRRELWLDESATAFTVVDRLSGDMQQGWRLDLTQGQLGSAKVDGQSQLITEHAGRAGIEVRDTTLTVGAVSRLPRTATLPAVGWSEDVESLRASLHLPPGWSVLFAKGVDETTNTWIARWDLFDVFHLLLVSLSLWRLAGAGSAAVAFLALLLTRGESGAPEYFWLPILGLVAVLRRIPQGRLQGTLSSTYRILLLLTGLTAVSFSVEQVRGALFPHLSYAGSGVSDFRTMAEAPEPAPLPRGAANEEFGASAPATPALSSSLEKKIGSVRPLRRSGGSAGGALPYAQKQLHADAVVQTGPGIPETPGPTAELIWSGPVVKNHHFQLFLVSPGLSRLATVLRLALLWSLIFLVSRPPGAPNAFPRPSARGAVPVGLLLAGLLLWSRPVLADQPTDERLAELKARLLRPAACEPNCLTVSEMRIALGERLQIQVDVHAAARGALQLPGPLATLETPTVELLQHGPVLLRQEREGQLVLRVEPGIWTVLINAMPHQDRFTLDLGLLPKRILVDAPGWAVTGIDDRGRSPGGAVTFHRELPLSKPGAGNGPATSAPTSDLPAYFHVERRLVLGVTTTVETTIRRLSDPSTPEILHLPLLPGEQPTTAELDVEGGVAEVSFPRETLERKLTSTLVTSGKSDDLRLQLSAPAQAERSESWLIDCGVVFHCRPQGLLPTEQTEGGRAVWHFRPFPGDHLELVAHRPQVAAGNTVTIHRATLTHSPGARSSQSKLELTIESSRPLTHTLRIPEQARLSSLSVAGHPQHTQPSAGNLSVNLPAGTSEVVVEWRNPRGLAATFHSEAVQSGAPGVNFRTIIDLPRERWLLWAAGPSQGPALLFWGYLVLIFAAAVLLPRLPYAPLNMPQWLLLGLGLTQVPAGVAVFIAGWFFAVGSRKAWPTWTVWRHNLLQLGLVGYSFAFLVALGVAIYAGLVSSPDMSIEGAGSSTGHLVWYRDRSDGALPSAWILSANLWIWRAFMLAWALWLSRALLAWLRWAWGETTTGGFWKPANKGRPPAQPGPQAPPAAQPETTPAEATPAEATPAEATPAEATPAEATPAEATPAEATPAETSAPRGPE